MDTTAVGRTPRLAWLWVHSGFLDAASRVVYADEYYADVYEDDDDEEVEV